MRRLAERNDHVSGKQKTVEPANGSFYRGDIKNKGESWLVTRLRDMSDVAESFVNRRV